jgi:ubiquinone/menaquinone biosynthesis C-methylase UbiE
VLGLDLSENMLARARTLTEDGQIEYAIADLEQLVLTEASFDLAYSSLAFHYIEDFGRLMRTVHTAPIPGAQLIFSIEHPIYMAPSHPG